MNDCIFCKIIRGEIPSKKIYEDSLCLAFHDINPEAPVHFLVVPKKHIESADAVSAGNSKYVARIFEIIPKIAADLGIANDGYRIVNNCGKNGMQTVMHLHFHVLGGRMLSWPPG